MTKTPPQGHKDICANKLCENPVKKDKKYCSKSCADAHKDDEQQAPDIR